MTYEQKITWMRIALNIANLGLNEEQIDLTLSMYELVQKKEGETDLKDISKIETMVQARAIIREEIKAKQKLNLNL